MRILEGDDLYWAERYMVVAAEQADLATCKRAKCGAVIVNDFEIIGLGYNSPPDDDERNRKCGMVASLELNPRHDQTCCVHAEWRAIHHTLSTYDKFRLKGSTLYFTRVNDIGIPLISGKPYCTVCSRLALDHKIAKFVLRHKEGMTEYDTVEYNNLSYAYTKGP